MVSCTEQSIDDKIKQAVIHYYGVFGTEDGVTVHKAASLYAVSSVQMHLYMADHPKVGMPDDREWALKYLKILENDFVK
jgi:hypothetical protein